MNRGGVYVYRTRKPGARFRVPFLSFHFGYVGETVSFHHRDRQHRDGQPWADREPRVVLRVPLPPWKWLLRSVETLLILALWPVYNHSKNRWNPRRIPLRTALAQRAARNRGRHPFNIRWIHFLLVAPAAATVVTWLVTR